MATLPVHPTPEKETVEERFRRLEATWMAEVGHHSSATRLVNHPAFQGISRLPCRAARTWPAFVFTSSGLPSCR